MKVVCVDNKGYEKCLTINKIYEANYIDKYETYVLTNDKDMKNSWYVSHRFITITEYRNDRIDKLLEDENNMY
jgi:hypothetical protein